MKKFLILLALVFPMTALAGWKMIPAQKIKLSTGDLYADVCSHKSAIFRCCGALNAGNCNEAPVEPCDPRNGDADCDEDVAFPACFVSDDTNIGPALLDDWGFDPLEEIRGDQLVIGDDSDCAAVATFDFPHDATVAALQCRIGYSNLEDTGNQEFEFMATAVNSHTSDADFFSAGAESVTDDLSTPSPVIAGMRHITDFSGNIEIYDDSTNAQCVLADCKNKIVKLSVSQVSSGTTSNGMAKIRYILCKWG